MFGDCIFRVSGRISIITRLRLREAHFSSIPLPSDVDRQPDQSHIPGTTILQPGLPRTGHVPALQPTGEPVVGDTEREGPQPELQLHRRPGSARRSLEAEEVDRLGC